MEISIFKGFGSDDSILSYGPELIINGGFDSGSGWVWDGGWTISGGLLVANASSAGGVHQTQILTVGKQYRVSFEIKEYTSGTVLFMQDYTEYTLRSAVGKYVEDFVYVVGSIPNRTELRTLAAFVGKIDNFSLFEIFDN